MSNTFEGGWKLAPSLKACDLPEDVATGFSQILGSLCGAAYEPLLYVGTQVVHGINHLVICKQSLAVQGGLERLVSVVLNQDADGGKVEGQWSLVSVEPLLSAH